MTIKMKISDNIDDIDHHHHNTTTTMNHNINNNNSSNSGNIVSSSSSSPSPITMFNHTIGAGITDISSYSSSLALFDPPSSAFSSPTTTTMLLPTDDVVGDDNMIVDDNDTMVVDTSINSAAAATTTAAEAAAAAAAAAAMINNIDNCNTDDGNVAVNIASSNCNNSNTSTSLSLVDLDNVYDDDEQHLLATPTTNFSPSSSQINEHPVVTISTLSLVPLLIDVDGDDEQLQQQQQHQLNNLNPAIDASVYRYNHLEPPTALPFQQSSTLDQPLSQQKYLMVAQLNNRNDQIEHSVMPIHANMSSNGQDGEDCASKETNKSANLNPMGPVEFIEHYRNRNSSQRPLVGSSFSSTSQTTSNTNVPSANVDPAMIKIDGVDHHRHHHYHQDLIDNEMMQPNDAKMDIKKVCNNNGDSSDDNADDDTDDTMPDRGQWSGKLDFIFSCISYAVGLGNVWRFPYLCYENGGGAFLIPYLISIIILGIPLFLMEVSLGQYLQAGGVSVWNKIPMLKGIGYASMVMIGLCNTYYIVIIAWTLYYLGNSFINPLPWSHCGNWWNTENCHDPDVHNSSANSVPPSTEFWEHNVLAITDDLSTLGSIQWHLFGTLILGWIIVYFVIHRGIHQSGKIIWFTAMFPYVVLTILFGYGLSLSGAGTGIKYYLSPDWAMLAKPKIWVAAGTQLLFTYGIGIGTNIALGSYNTFNHNFLRDSLIACCLSSFTSLFSGFVIFSVLGHLAETLNTTVADVARSGPGLTFIIYPEAISRLPIPNFWSFLFFIMLLVLGIDSQFCTVESFITGIVDEWPRFLRPRRQLFTAFIVLLHFILGISMITGNGMYVFQLMDNFSASGISLLTVVLLELLAFGWIYGGDRIYQHMCKMLGFKPYRILYYLWMYISPAALLGILAFSIVKYEPPEYAGKPFPWYGTLVGWIIASASIVCIPLYLVYYLWIKSDRTLSLKERFIQGLSDGSDPATPAAISSSTSSSSNVSINSAIDLEKQSTELLDDNHNHADGGSHHRHHNRHHHNHNHHHHQNPNHLQLSNFHQFIPINSKHGSNSTLSTTIAADQQSFNNSA